MQKTEELVGPYELHDFFLFHFLRFGVSPAKLLFLAGQAFGAAYETAVIRRWLRVFDERFFQHQFKRSVLPDGPKVGSVCLSPRGDWRMPSDASVAAWVAELDALEPAPRQAARPRPRTQAARARNKKKTAPRAASRPPSRRARRPT